MADQIINSITELKASNMNGKQLSSILKNLPLEADIRIEKKSGTKNSETLYFEIRFVGRFKSRGVDNEN